VAKHEPLWYFRAVTEALGTGWQHPALDELREQVAVLHKLSATPM
jgi:hypothetical protein